MSDTAWQELRAYDYPAYISGIFAPNDKRQAIWAVFALHTELSRIASLVKEPMLGLIRLQWWRDEIAGTPRTPLTKLLAQLQLPEDSLLAMINAHEADFEQIEHLDHAAQAFMPLFQLQAKILNSADAEIESLARACGLAFLILRHRLDEYLQQPAKQEALALFNDLPTLPKPLAIYAKLTKAMLQSYPATPSHLRLVWKALTHAMRPSHGGKAMAGNRR